MALPIAATPVLEGKDAKQFLDTIKNDLETPVALTATPKLEQARELIRDYDRKKRLC